MMLSIALALTTLLAISTAHPSPSTPAYEPPSTGFQLILNSKDVSLDGHALGACHQGAAIEGLCLSEARFDDVSSSYTFYHNASNSQNSAANAFDTPGTMIWILHTTEWAVPSAMNFVPTSGTNQQNMIFTPGIESTSYVSFDKAGRMYRQKVQNGGWASPRIRRSSKTGIGYESWYICLTHYNYEMNSLVWVDGDAPVPQDSTCRPVGVQRLWV